MLSPSRPSSNGPAPRLFGFRNALGSCLRRFIFPFGNHIFQLLFFLSRPCRCQRFPVHRNEPLIWRANNHRVFICFGAAFKAVEATACKRYESARNLSPGLKNRCLPAVLRRFAHRRNIVERYSMTLIVNSRSRFYNFWRLELHFAIAGYRGVADCFCSPNEGF